MHTLIILAIGLALLVACVQFGFIYLGGKPGRRRAALAFLPLWLVGAGINLWVGVNDGGYPLADELPIFAVVFGIPAAIAGVIAWKSR